MLGTRILRREDNWSVIALASLMLGGCEGELRSRPVNSGGVAGSDASLFGSGGTATKPALTGSCAGACLGQAKGGCWCDGQCEHRRDCCEDFEPFCASRVLLPAGCVTSPWVLALCNPVTNEGCAPEEKCKLHPGGLLCMGGLHALAEGDSCNPVQGYTEARCGKGLHCQATEAGDELTGTCKKLCCSNADCTAGECHAFDPQLGNLGRCE